MLVENVIQELPEYPTEYADGTPQAHRNLYDSDLAFDYQKVKYRVVWDEGVAAEDRHAVKWLVVFEPEDDPATPEDESKTKAEIVDTPEWNGAQEQSTPYEIDPESLRAGKDGRYYMMPIEITVVFGEGPGNGDTGVSSKENFEDYLETVKIAQAGDIWCVTGAADHLFGIEVALDEVTLKHALATQGHTVIFDGHANYGLGPNFSKSTHKTIGSFTNFGSITTDVPITQRGDGSETDVMPYKNGQLPWPHGEELQQLLVIQRLIDSEGWAYLVIAPSDVKGEVQNEPVPHMQARWKFESNHGVSAGNSLSKVGMGLGEFHFITTETLSKRVIISAPDDDLPPLRYKTFFYNACSSGPHFIKNFQHGEFIYTNRSCAVFDATPLYVKGIIEGKTTAEILQILEEANADGEFNSGVQTYEVKSF